MKLTAGGSLALIGVPTLASCHRRVAVVFMTLFRRTNVPFALRVALHTTPILCSLSLAVIFASAAAAQTPNVSGTWISDSDSSLKWILDQKDGKMRIQEVAGDKVKADFTCSLSGEECSVKEDGRSAKLMLYFNGDALVKISERGSDTVKQRLTITVDGKTLNVKTVPLSSSQKAETVSFRRQDI